MFELTQHALRTRTSTVSPRSSTRATTRWRTSCSICSRPSSGSRGRRRSPTWVRFRECEYVLPVEVVPDAVRALKALVEREGWRISFPVEVRVATADDVWLSTAYGRASGYVAVHRFWRDDHLPYLRAVDALMRSLGGRPHWGKIHFQAADELRQRYPRFDDFVAVRDRLDPDRVFANTYLRRVLGD